MPHLPWTWYSPDMRQALRHQEMYQEKDFRGLRRAGVKFYDVNHHKWCLFPDNFKEELYLKGVLQEWLPPRMPERKPPPNPPEQQNLF